MKPKNKQPGRDRTTALGTESVGKLLKEFSVPAIIAMTFNALYNVMDRIFIGNAPNLGASGLAAITVAFPAMIVSLALGILVGQGGSVMYSIRLGEGKDKEAKRIIGNSLALMIFFGLLLAISGEIFIDQILLASGADASILPYGQAYLRIIFIGVTFQIISIGMNNFLRADGKPRLSMISVASGAITNVLLDAIFIFGFKMGMQGAALATILAQFLSMSICLYQLTGNRTAHPIQLKFIRLNGFLSKDILILGIPGFILQAANSFITVMMNQYLLFYGGVIAVSGMGIVSSVQTLLHLPIVGLNQGLKPILGYNFGARKFERVRSSVLLSIKIVTIMSVVGFLIVQLFPTFIVSLFNREPELLDFGVKALRIWTCCLPVVGFQILGSNFFQAIGKPNRSILLTMLRQIIILIPAIILFSKFWGMNGILIAGPFSDFVSAAITGIFFVSFMKHQLPKENA